jgi:hypothetical protein
MKNSTYQSVPVIASVIGSKSRKAMYLVHITSLDGTKIYKDTWVPTSWKDFDCPEEQFTINWDNHTDTYVEFPLNQATDAMMLEKYDTTYSGVSRVKERLINNKVTRFYTMTERYVIYIPVWKFKNMKVKYSLKQDNAQAVKSVEQLDLFPNEYDHMGIAERTAYESHNQDSLQDRADGTVLTGHSDYEVALKQWEQDNPDYMTL